MAITWVFDCIYLLMDNSPYLRSGIGETFFGEPRLPKPRFRKTSLNSRKSSSSCKTNNSCTNKNGSLGRLGSINSIHTVDPFVKARKTLQLNFEQALQNGNRLKSRLKKCSRLNPRPPAPPERKCCPNAPKMTKLVSSNSAYLQLQPIRTIEKMRQENNRLRQLLLVRSLPARHR
jgi:hypothetical protein